jgi:hypothetical protein
LDTIKLEGYVKHRLIKADGTVVEIEGTNVVTTAGKGWLAQYITSSTPPANMNYMGWGSGAGTPAATDTALFTELSGNGYARASVTKSSSGQTAQFQATLTGLSATPAAPITVTEVGIFNATTGGTMLAHQMTGTVQFTSNQDTLQTTWQITFS